MVVTVGGGQRQSVTYGKVVAVRSNEARAAIAWEGTR
jgi:hypothetical protein